MNSESLRKVLLANGYSTREQFGNIIGVSPGSDFPGRCEASGINVLRCRIKGGTEWQFYPTSEAGRYKKRPVAAKKEAVKDLPLMAYGENEAKLRAEYEEFKAWKQANNKETK